MVQLTGIVANLETSDTEDSGTDDHLYIGVVGTGGGREFPLNSEKEDFITGEKENFLLGSVWDPTEVDSSTKFPLESEPGKNNDPALYPLNLDNVSFVYLRKQGDNTTEDDDAYKLQFLRVVLYGPSPPSRRIFNTNNNNAVLLANENGHVVYLQELGVG